MNNKGKQATCESREHGPRCLVDYPGGATVGGTVRVVVQDKMRLTSSHVR